MQLRPARPADAETLRAIARAAYAPYLARMDRTPAPVQQDFAAAVAAGRVDVLADGTDDAAVGYIVHFADGDGWFVENLAVSPHIQGSGAGGALLAAAEAAARAHGLGRVRLYTNAAMTESLAFYERRGYVRTGRRTEDGFDRIFLAKALDETHAGRPGGGTRSDGGQNDDDGDDTDETGGPGPDAA